MAQAKYELLAKYRSGWSLVALPDGRKFLRRAFQGQYPVTAVKSGLIWEIRSAASGERIYPDRLR